MSFIIHQTQSIMRNALKHFSEKISKQIDSQVNPSNVQLIISTQDDTNCTPKYKLLYNYRPHKRAQQDGSISEEVSFLEILDVKIDFLNRQEMANPFMAGAIKRLSSEIQAKPSETNIMIFTNDDKAFEPLLNLYKGSVAIRQLSFEKDIFLTEQNI